MESPSRIVIVVGGARGTEARGRHAPKDGMNFPRQERHFLPTHYIICACPALPNDTATEEDRMAERYEAGGVADDGGDDEKDTIDRSRVRIEVKTPK